MATSARVTFGPFGGTGIDGLATARRKGLYSVDWADQALSTWPLDLSEQHAVFTSGFFAKSRATSARHLCLRSRQKWECETKSTAYHDRIADNEHLRVPRVPRREKGHPCHPSPTSRPRVYPPRPRQSHTQYPFHAHWAGLASALSRPWACADAVAAIHGGTSPPSPAHRQAEGRCHFWSPARKHKYWAIAPARLRAYALSSPMCLHPHAPSLLAVSPLCRRTRTHRAARHDGARAAAKSDPTLLFIAPSPTHRALRRWKRTGNPIHGSQVAAPSASSPRPRPHRSPFPTSHASSSPRMRRTPRLRTSQLIAHHLPQHRAFLPSSLAVGRRRCKCAKRHPSSLDRCPAHVPSFVLRALRLRVDVTPAPAGDARSTTPSLRRPPRCSPLPSPPPQSREGKMAHPKRKPPPACHIRPRAHMESVLGRVAVAADAPADADAGGRAGPQRACTDIRGGT
ncbi:hypothetical protein B0H14DRAFT_3857758 [Mycena olivaceomarginata]|nr:hypothetical protein B0H14DRAFT_3857758 [Mycena olivaceomarginata]